MKRILAVLAVLGLAPSLALADYAKPPGWQDNPFFTHQSWDFLHNTINTKSDGEVPVVNSYGVPTALTSSGGTWTNALGRGDGGWRFNGPTALDSAIMLIIPNSLNENLLKQIWLQASFQADFPLNPQTDVSFNALANGGKVYLPNTYEFEVIDPGRVLARITACIDINPQPENEIINIAVDIPAGHFIFFDEVDVDTRCIIPEPATPLLLLVAASTALLVYRRRST
jgi:hypothetical protein